MDDREVLFRLFQEKKSCSKAILHHYGKGLGISEERLDCIASALEAGLGIGESCGVLVAAFIIVGLRTGRAHGPMGLQENGRVQEMAKSMAIKFTEEFGSIKCRELVGFDMVPPNTGFMGISQEDNLMRRLTLCGRYVAFVADMLDESIEKN